MLAKMWKKVLLAICIIACLFNITTKLVSRTSLEVNLKSVKDGESILSIFEEKEDNTLNNNEETQAAPADKVLENSSINENSSTQTNIETNNSEELTTDENSPITDFVVVY